jgi:PAS domain S-box-containing protein
MYTSRADNPGFRTLAIAPEEILARLTPEQTRDHLMSLQEVTEAVLAHLSLAELMPEILNRLSAVLAVDSATVLLSTEDGRAYTVGASAGPCESLESRTEVPLGKGIAGYVAMSRQPVIVDDVSRVGTVRPELKQLSSLMAAPLLVEGEILGILHVGAVEPRHFSGPDLYLLQVVADRVALAVKNALLYDRTQSELKARRQVEARLEARERLHRLVLETTADAIITMDADSIIISANPAAAEIFGYSIEDLPGLPMPHLMPERFRKQHRAGVVRYLRTGERRIPWRGLELPGLRRDGKEILLDIAFADIEQDGRHYFTGTMRDITERKRTEQLLAVQYAVTRALAGAPDLEGAIPEVLRAIGESLEWDIAVFWIWTEQEGVLKPLDVWRAAGLETEDFETRTRELVFAPGEGLPGRVRESSRPAWILDVTQDVTFARREVAAQTGICAGFAFPVCMTRDCFAVIELFTRSAREPDAALIDAMEALGSDIGQFIRRRRAEERLREREETQSFLARASSVLAASTIDYDSTLRELARQAVPTLADWCAVYIRDEQGEVVPLEIAHADVTLEDLARRLLRYPIAPADPHPVLQVIRTGEPVLLREVSDEELRRVARDEEHLELLRSLGIASVAIVALEARGRTLGALVLIATESGRRFDPDDLEVAEEFAGRAALAIDNARLYRETLEASRVKSEFMAVISHELRTPLNAVVGYAELLKMGIAEGEPERATQYAQRIGLSARHLTELIEEVLSFSRLEAGREVIAPERVRIADLLDEIRAVAEPLAGEKGLDLVVSDETDAAELFSDPGKLRQILLNLVSNGIKFTDRGEVRVEASTTGDRLVVTVRDTGIGLSSEHRDRIFEPFWQVEQGTTRARGGTGLGLSVTKRLVDLLGGEIALESAPGRGSAFTLLLPKRYQPRTARDREQRGTRTSVDTPVSPPGDRDHG